MRKPNKEKMETGMSNIGMVEKKGTGKQITRFCDYFLGFQN